MSELRLWVVAAAQAALTYLLLFALRLMVLSFRGSMHACSLVSGFLAARQDVELPRGSEVVLLNLRDSQVVMGAVLYYAPVCCISVSKCF